MTSAQAHAQRKVRFILINAVRALLALTIAFSYAEGRSLLLLASALLLAFTFLPAIAKLIFKKDYFYSLDFIILIFIFGIFSYWEIHGEYSNFVLLALIMRLIAATAIGFLGLTIIYSFFKHAKLEPNFKIIALFAFCLSFTIGIFIELIESALDAVFGFHIQAAGVFGLAGDISIYFTGSLLVSFVGYFSIKRGKVLFVSTMIEQFLENHFKSMSINETGSNPAERIKELAKKGESHNLEFKSSLRKNLHTNAMDRKMEHAVLKTISAYLNSEGGTLLVGVSDKGEILGIKEDQFESKDNVNRHLNNLILNHIGAESMPFINYDVIDVDGKELIAINCRPSTKEVFVKYDGDEQFFVRRGPHSVPLIGSSLLSYIETKFRKQA